MRIIGTIKSIYFHILEKKYGKNEIRYIYQKQRESDVLIVVFSGFAGAGMPARYNYIRTLKDIKANKLYILDDFGYQNRGGYYLVDREGTFNGTIIQEIAALVEKYAKNRKVITVGSSKGGSAALLYGILCRADMTISGAPQYYIGDYLNCDSHKKILKSIYGSSGQEAVAALNEILPCAVKDHAGDSHLKVFVHCSKNEHTYKDHVEDMVRDLNQNGYSVLLDAEYCYTDHKDVAKYFPPYLLKVLKKELRINDMLIHMKKVTN